MTSSKPMPGRLRPYARLLTMLGEQLIKNERIALTELVKNSYDADATRVQIRFEGFGDDLRRLPGSRIIVADNGHGMTAEVVRDHWLNPATNVKAEQKRQGQTKTLGGRVVQGEKGIGRFAMFKLGSLAEVTTRARGEDAEVSASLDVRFLDSDPGLTTNESSASTGPAFLDEVEVIVSQGAPVRFTTSSELGAHGTEIVIGALRSDWSLQKLTDLSEDLLRLRPLRQLLTGDTGNDELDFEIEYLINGKRPEGLREPETFLESLSERAVLKVVGTYESKSNAFNLTINDQDRFIELESLEIRGLELYYRHVSKEREARKFSCGDFAFEFAVFDMRQSAEATFQLNPVERDLIKQHRIYLYRDQVRVLPYGDPDDDWLRLDAIRGTVGANRLFSNDQTIGFVYITQDGNPDLRDKTNREGLIDSGAAYQDFIHLLQLLINYLRKGDFSRYLQNSRQRKEVDQRKTMSAIDQQIDRLHRVLADKPAAKRAFADFINMYKVERDFMQARVERSEDLAGVGLSVETASHDVIASSNQAYRDAALMVDELRDTLGSEHELTLRASALSEAISFIVSRLQDVQGLFVSSRKRAKPLDIVQYVRKIEAIYSRTLAASGITVEVLGDEQLQVVTHEATLLQIFLNLVDNAVYWLGVADAPEPRITVSVDAEKREILFSDNGPGIDILDVPYIFEPFFSAKGDEGRGLGLYIARQVALRDGFDLELVHPSSTADGRRTPATFRLRHHR